MKCPQCNVSHSNPKFCSQSCAAKYNNVKFPKRKTERKCASSSGCDKLVAHYRTSLCKSHLAKSKETRSESYRNATLKEYREKASVKDKHPSWTHSHIRRFARSWLKHLITKPCHCCGYDKHVELCHIKAISSFPETATIGEVNHKDNIIQLCRNCHWEFDKGLLKL